MVLLPLSFDDRVDSFEMRIDQRVAGVDRVLQCFSCDRRRAAAPSGESDSKFESIVLIADSTRSTASDPTLGVSSAVAHHSAVRSQYVMCALQFRHAPSLTEPAGTVMASATACRA